MSNDGSAISERDALVRAGVPEHLMHLCDIDIWSRNKAVSGHVTIQAASDATPDELSMLGDLGFGLHISPAGTLDLRDLGDGIAHFALITGYAELPEISNPLFDDPEWRDSFLPQPGGECIHHEALESALRLERLGWEGEPRDDVDLSSLPALREVSGIALLSAAASNPHLRVIDEGFTNLPAHFRCEAPVEDVTIRVRRSFTDLSCLRDVSQLRCLEIRGPASFDLGSLNACQALEELTIIECRELLRVETLQMLPNLRVVRFEGARSIPGIGQIDRMHFRLELFPNYLVTPQHEKTLNANALPGLESTLDRYRSSVRPFISENTNLQMVAGSDSTSFAPFEVNELPDEVGYEIMFDDWAGLADLLLGDDADEGDISGELPELLAEKILSKDAPDLLEGDRLVFDSESEFMRLESRSRDDIERAARILGMAWLSKRRMRSLAKGLL